MDLVSVADEVAGEVVGVLGGRRDVGPVDLIDEEDTHGLVRLGWLVVRTGECRPCRAGGQTIGRLGIVLRIGLDLIGPLAHKFGDLAYELRHGSASLGECVLDAGRDLGVGGAVDEAEAFEFAESFAEDFGGQARQRSLDLARARGAPGEFFEDGQGPLASEHVGDAVECLGSVGRDVGQSGCVHVQGCRVLGVLFMVTALIVREEAVGVGNGRNRGRVRGLWCA